MHLIKNKKIKNSPLIKKLILNSIVNKLFKKNLLLLESNNVVTTKNKKCIHTIKFLKNHSRFSKNFKKTVSYNINCSSQLQIFEKKTDFLNYIKEKNNLKIYIGFIKFNSFFFRNA